MKSFEPSAVLRTCYHPQDFDKLSRGAALEVATRRPSAALRAKGFFPRKDNFVLGIAVD
jgi:hypothetical protein